eukprot:1152706-Pelagomonas_calceolata.AAC.1
MAGVASKGRGSYPAPGAGSRAGMCAVLRPNVWREGGGNMQGGRDPLLRKVLLLDLKLVILFSCPTVTFVSRSAFCVQLVLLDSTQRSLKQQGKDKSETGVRSRHVPPLPAHLRPLAGCSKPEDTPDYGMLVSNLMRAQPDAPAVPETRLSWPRSWCAQWLKDYGKQMLPPSYEAALSSGDEPDSEAYGPRDPLSKDPLVALDSDDLEQLLATNLISSPSMSPVPTWHLPSKAMRDAAAGACTEQYPWGPTAAAWPSSPFRVASHRGYQCSSPKGSRHQGCSSARLWLSACMQHAKLSAGVATVLLIVVRPKLLKSRNSCSNGRSHAQACSGLNASTPNSRARDFFCQHILRTDIGMYWTVWHVPPSDFLYQDSNAAPPLQASLDLNVVFLVRCTSHDLAFPVDIWICDVLKPLLSRGLRLGPRLSEPKSPFLDVMECFTVHPNRKHRIPPSVEQGRKHHGTCVRGLRSWIQALVAA